MVLAVGPWYWIAPEILQYVFVLFIAIGIFFFWLTTLINVITRKTAREFTETAKIVWVLVIIFLGLIGSALYCLISKPKLKSRPWTWAKWFFLVGLVGFIVFFVIASIVATLPVPANA